MAAASIPCARQSLLPGLTLQIAPRGIHRLAAFVATDLTAAALLGSYDGGRPTPELDHQVTYVFSMSNGSTLDGGREGNGRRHIYHACLPNCEVVEEYGLRGDWWWPWWSTCSRVRVGWSMGSRIDTGLVLDAPVMAPWRLRPQAASHRAF